MALSAENFRTLGERYSQLLSRYKQLADRRDQVILDLEQRCRELLAVKDFAGLDDLNRLQTELQVLTFNSLSPPPNVRAEHGDANFTHHGSSAETNTHATVLSLHHPDHTVHVVDAAHSAAVHSADHSIPVVQPDHHARTHTTETNLQSDDCYAGNMCSIM